jgi:phage baseplate assembly protein W
MRYSSYTVKQGDTLEALSTRLFGTAARAKDLAALNKLRWPYISDDPRDILGTAIASFHLVANSNGDRTLVVDGFNQTASAAGNWVLLRGYGGNIGVPFFDTAVIFGVSQKTPQGQIWSREMAAEFTPTQLAAFPSGNIIYLTGGPNHAYVAGSELLIYNDPNETPTHVVSTGQSLLLPLDTVVPNVFSALDGVTTSLLGVDIALDNHGLLNLDTTKDLIVVSGDNNMAQAIRLRLVTFLRELTMHPDYGNKLLESLGKTSDTLIPVAYAATIEALLADPRVLRVTNVNITQRGDALICNLTVELRDKSLIGINDLVLAVGLD